MHRVMTSDECDTGDISGPQSVFWISEGTTDFAQTDRIENHMEAEQMNKFEVRNHGNDQKSAGESLGLE
jgi:hypothetical protein